MLFNKIGKNQNIFQLKVWDIRWLILYLQKLSILKSRKNACLKYTYIFYFVSSKVLVEGEEGI